MKKFATHLFIVLAVLFLLASGLVFVVNPDWVSNAIQRQFGGVLIVVAVFLSGYLYRQYKGKKVLEEALNM